MNNDKNRFIDFQCSGELVAAHRVREATADDPAKFAVLVHYQKGIASWVVSYYTDGATDWDSGNYFDTHKEAAACLANRCSPISSKAGDAVRFPL